jgi:hypothetical protein
MRPVSRRDAESRDPVNGATARRAVEDEQSEIALEVSLRVEELEPEPLCVERYRVGTLEPRVDGLVDDRVCRNGCSLSTRTAR